MDLVEEDEGLRAISTETGKNYADEIGAIFMEASAKTGHNVTEIFNRIGFCVFNETPASAASPTAQQSKTVSLDEPPKEKGKKKGCC